MRHSMCPNAAVVFDGDMDVDGFKGHDGVPMRIRNRKVTGSAGVIIAKWDFCKFRRY